MTKYITSKDYESLYEEHLRRNQEFLQMFAKDIENLSPMVQKSHMNNLETFLNDYLVQRVSVPMEKGIGYVKDYFEFFLPMKGMCSGEELRLAATSVKKFYKSMTLYSVVEAEEYKYLCNTLSDGMEEWIQECIYTD